MHALSITGIPIRFAVGQGRGKLIASRLEHQRARKIDIRCQQFDRTAGVLTLEGTANMIPCQPRY